MKAEAGITHRTGRSRLRPGLYLVLTEPRDGYETLAEQAVLAGLPALQLRYKGTDQRHHLALARSLRSITRGSSTLFLVNDRPDIALMAEADGVHIGQEDLPAEAVRHLIGEEMLLGLSTHNLDQVAAARLAPVDYIGFGPIYPTTSKADPDPVTGPAMLSEAARISTHPIVAIGGLTLELLATIPPGSCRNVAVIRQVAQAADPRQMMSALNRLCSQLCSPVNSINLSQ